MSAIYLAKNKDNKYRFMYIYNVFFLIFISFARYITFSGSFIGYVFGILSLIMGIVFFISNFYPLVAMFKYLKGDEENFII